VAAPVRRRQLRSGLERDGRIHGTGRGDEAAPALEHLHEHNVPYYGPRTNKGGEIHIDFEDPDGHMLEYWARASFEPLPDRPVASGSADEG